MVGSWWSASPRRRTCTRSAMPDLGQLFDYQFMVNALEAGGVVAVMAAVVGWFMVVRRQTFAGHTLSVIAFPGAAGAALAGIPVAWGYYAACAVGALALSPAVRGERSHSSESAVIGTGQAIAYYSPYPVGF